MLAVVMTLVSNLSTSLLLWGVHWVHLHKERPQRLAVKFLLFLLRFSSVQLLSRIQLFATPWIAARLASLSITNSRSSLRLTAIESVMPSSHLILCRPLLLLPPIPPILILVPLKYDHHLVGYWCEAWTASSHVIILAEATFWKQSVCQIGVNVFCLPHINISIHDISEHIRGGSW